MLSFTCNCLVLLRFNGKSLCFCFSVECCSSQHFHAVSRFVMCLELFVGYWEIREGADSLWPHRCATTSSGALILGRVLQHQVKQHEEFLFSSGQRQRQRLRLVVSGCCDETIGCAAVWTNSKVGVGVGAGVVVGVVVGVVAAIAVAAAVDTGQI